jgi:glycosyltransferase involved in cell wall biosynthesis
MGVSALVRARDEEDWIEASLRSLEGFVDEAIVVDNGSADRTAERARGLVGRVAFALTVESAPALDHTALSNYVLGRARFRWLLRWDADCVAHTSGPNALAGFRARLEARPVWRHTCVHPAAVELAGDLFHRPADLALRYDAHLVTHSPALRYATRVAGRGERAYAVEVLRLPLYYVTERWTTPAIFHVNVKPARRMLLRHYWQAWWAERPDVPLEAYVLARAPADWGTTDLDAAAAAFTARYCRRLVRFDPAPYGGYPALLAPALARPAYRLLYAGGAVVGRSDVGAGV